MSDDKQRLAEFLEDLARQVRAGELASEVWVTGYSEECTEVRFGTRRAVIAKEFIRIERVPKKLTPSSPYQMTRDPRLCPRCRRARHYGPCAGGYPPMRAAATPTMKNR